MAYVSRLEQRIRRGQQLVVCYCSLILLKEYKMHVVASSLLRHAYQTLTIFYNLTG